MMKMSWIWNKSPEESIGSIGDNYILFQWDAIIGGVNVKSKVGGGPIWLFVSSASKALLIHLYQLQFYRFWCMISIFYQHIRLYPVVLPNSNFSDN